MSLIDRSKPLTQVRPWESPLDRESIAARTRALPGVISEPGMEALVDSDRLRDPPFVNVGLP